MNENVCAIVVLFRPEVDLVLNFLNKILEQVNTIVLVDNTPLEFKNYSSEIFIFDRLNYIDLGNNLGIAKAHNEGIKKSIELKSEYVIIFDQDSSIKNGFIDGLLEIDKIIRAENHKVAAVGPAYIDIKTNLRAPIIRFNGLKVDRIQPEDNEIFTVADYIISSGTLIRTEVFKIVGLMKEELFIDYVDTEWGLRAKKMGYHCYVANKVVMHHSIGDRSLKVPFSKKYVNIHSDFRKYFIIRNAFYLIIYSDLQLNWRVVQIPKTFMYFFFLILFVSPRIKNIKIFLLALRDALIKNMGKGSM